MEECLDLLRRARRAVESSADLASALGALARVIVPALGDWCAIDVMESPDDVRRMVVHHPDASLDAACRELEGRFPVPPSSLLAATLRGGHTVTASGAGEAARVSLDPGGDAIARVTALGFGSAVCVPILVQQRVLGTVTLVTAGEGPQQGRVRNALVRAIAHSAGAAVWRCKLLEDAETRHRQNDEFLATLGHELRNPIGAISSAVAALAARGAPDPKAARLYEVIERQSRQLGRLVEDLLDVTRLSTGRVALRVAPVDLLELARRCVATAKLGPRGGGRRLRVDGTAVRVVGDAARLEQVLANLLDNALKYTPPEAAIAVAVSREGDSATIVVSDDGPGVTDEVRSRLFEPFVRSPEAPGGGPGGLGLGLALVRRLVELHEGSVALESLSGGGTVVTVKLPAAGAAEIEPARPPEVAVPVSARWILVVDDEEDVRAALCEWLRGGGHRVEEVGDGASAVALALRLKPDVALIDLGLPGMSGFDVAARIRSAPPPHPYLVALTGYGQAEAQARAAGFDGFLVKPVDPDQLARLFVAAEGMRPPAVRSPSGP